MKKIFLIRLLIPSLLILGTSCGSDKGETRGQTQEEVPDGAENATAAVRFEAHQVEAYPDAIIEMFSPLGNENFAEGKVPFEFNIKNYPFTEGLRGFQYRLSINGDNPISYHLPIFQRDLKPGSYRVVGYLIDQEGLALKEFGNYVDRDFTVGESKPFPDLDEPYMVLNLPEEKQSYATDQDVIIDFLLIGGGVKEDGLKFLVEVNGQQHQVRDLNPLAVKGLSSGQHTVTVKLVRESGEELDGIFSSAKRSITIE
jgi:hypothetical protein